MAKASETSAEPKSAQRHVEISTSPVGMRRPVRPPTEVPAMYRPMARGRALSSSSSESHAIAVAGAPDSSAPCRPRTTMSCHPSWARGTMSPTPVAATAEMSRIRPRPKRSERIDAGTTHSASAPVAADTVMAASVEERPMLSTSVGRMAWVEYRLENIAKPTRSMATVARRVRVISFSLPGRAACVKCGKLH